MMKTALPFLVWATVLVGGCARYEGYTPSGAFEAAFDLKSAPGVTPVNGFYRTNTEWLVSRTDVWFVQLRGPGVPALVQARWPDLRPSSAKVSFVASHPELAWWNTSVPRQRWESAADARYSIEKHEASGDYFISFMSGR